MIPLLFTDPASQNLNTADAELLSKLKSNPILDNYIRALLNQFESEVEAGMDAREAEEMAIAQV